MKRLVIIDGKSVFYRGYYAMGALSTSDGTPTGGVYGFAAIAMEIVQKLDPTKVVVAWDSRTSTSRRKAVYPEYKAGRVKPGDDFYAQIPLLKELVRALGWGFVECDDCEADDIIGTLALQADEDGDYETFIVSSDLDMLQVVDENTRMYRILQGFSRLEELDVPAVEAKYGIKKAQFLDLKALKGDASDNIPGVPGIGEKTAVKLLGSYGTLDGVYEALDAGKIEGKIAEKLTKGRESAKMSYFLAKIMTDVDVKLNDLPDLEIDDERVVAALKKLEFRTLVGKFLRARGNAGQVVKEMKAQMRNALRPSKSEQRVARAEKKASAGLSQQTLEIPVEMPDGLILSWNVKDLMHKNAKVAERIFAGAEFWDLAQGAFLLNPLVRNLERQDEKVEYERQKAEFETKPELKKILMEFDLPLIPVLYEMEERGMLIDRPYFEGLKEEFLKEVAGREREIWKLAGTEFNVNSPAQLSEVFFTRLGLPTKGIKKGSRGYSTGAKELDKLQKYHPIIEKIKEYREAAKLLSTYIEPIPELADKADRVHTTFNQNVTATGRLSSTNPNLQNIPVRTEVGRQIRTGFIAGPGKVLVSADYSQFELRLAAVLAGDQALIDDFNSDVDIHTKTAAEAFGVAPEDVTKTQRRAAKVINFGVLYGMSVRGLSEATGMSLSAAKDFIERYFELRKPVKEYLDKVLVQAREQGYVETYYGRRRPTPDVLSSNFIVRTGAERAAQNMPIQGTEADLMKRAMLAVKVALPKGAEMIMQVHDSLIIECDENLAEEVSKILVEKMENVAPELAVKLKAEVTIGQNWGEL
jgi:DNA polymerase-1